MAKKKVRRKKAKRVKRRVRRARVAARAGGAKGAIAELSAYRKRLLTDRAVIDDKVTAVESALRAIGIAPAAGPRKRRAVGRKAVRGRAVRAGSLKHFIGRVLTGRGIMSVKDITSGVLKAGYKTKNKTLGKSVGIALTQMKDVRKVGRGRFRLK